MKKHLFFLLSLSLFLTLSVMNVFASGEHHRSLDKVLRDIRTEQKLKQNAPINPAKVSPKLLEELGDVVMSFYHPDPRVHKQMDDMMGGEGSPSLKAMHRSMGYRYLSGYGDGYGMGMRNSGTMGCDYGGYERENVYGRRIYGRRGRGYGRRAYGQRGGMMKEYDYNQEKNKKRSGK